MPHETLSAATAACTDADHDALKVDRQAFRSGTQPLGSASDGKGGNLELRQCLRCLSTLSMPAAAPAWRTPEGERTTHFELRFGWRLIVRRDGLAELASDETGQRVELEVIAQRPMTLRMVARQLGAWLIRAARYYSPEHPARMAAEGAQRQVHLLLARWEGFNV